MSAVLVQAPPGSAVGFECYGAARKFWAYQGIEAVLAGPYETGKTIAALQKLNAMLGKYAGARALMVRKTYKSLLTSAVVTLEQKVFPYPPGHMQCPVTAYGNTKPYLYLYPNGSSLTLGGMDSPDKLLSSEWDVIYINQVEELTIDDYEKLCSRATGRAGNTPYPQVMGDCNPGPPRHWILARERLRLFHSKHKDNPVLFDPHTGKITEQGVKTMAALDALTGVRHKRGRLGLWAGAEGMVYENYDMDVHLIDSFPIPEHWQRFRSIDLGWRNPFVCQWWALDEDDRMYLYREIYMSQRTVREHAELINKLSEGERYIDTISDHDASDRATLWENGVQTTPADKDVEVGLDRVLERLKIQGDEKPRIFFFRDALVEKDPYRKQEFQPLCTTDEILSYAYPKTKAEKTHDERPTKLHDHGMDAMRYAVMSRDNRVNWWVI